MSDLRIELDIERKLHAAASEQIAALAAELAAVKARLAEATDLVDEAYNHGDTASWGERASRFLYPQTDAALAPTVQHSEITG